ncbi:hypothetical protein CANARDRAFT_9281 [[Candida] arabinofermentans NRRL YB-2248]|uniref:Amino acid permease/ SLC12A domain-containing protein n=1 Tax=[Candida] arabinofermentans NRRL YB-2248 TaxID=983967 RepID=A0A1E4SW75_9ASCO|nr:hypothetical protein CANARDRAFT_9281 [[Candida] arabinofermentans NRRL YB-2248]
MSQEEPSSSENRYSLLLTPELQERIRHLGDHVLHNEALNERLRTIGDQVLHNEAFNERIRNIGDHVIHDIWQDDDETQEVEHFNYKQELKKKFSIASIIGLGFSLMNVPFGIASTLSIGLVCGSSFTILWGWVLFSFFTVMISLSLSEIAARFPSSGGVYHFSSILANEKYSLISSWFTGWFLVLGNWLMFISYAFGGSQFILSIFGLKQSDYKHDDYIVLLTYFGIIALCTLVNLKFQSQLERINKLCIYWTIYTVLVMDFLLMIFSNDFHDLKYILTNFDASRSGWPDALAFIIGGIQFASLTFNGYGMIVSMSEEVKEPEKTIPKGLIMSVLISALTGLIFIIPILSILPDLNSLLDDNPDIFPIDIVFKLSTKSFLVSFVLVILIAGSLTFATIGSLTTASRTVYAFGRDHGLPFNSLWQQVDTMENEEIVPKNALLLSVGVSCFLGSFSLVSSSAFNAFVGCAVISLNLANGIPILSSILNKRKKIKGSAFKLRKIGYLVNILSCIFIVLTIIVLCFPPSRYIDIRTMNYAVLVFFLFTFGIAIGYFSWGKKNFQGPLLDRDYSAESQIGTVPLEIIQSHDHDISGDGQFVEEDPEYFRHGSDEDIQMDTNDDDTETLFELPDHSSISSLREDPAKNARSSDQADTS